MFSRLHYFQKTTASKELSIQDPLISIIWTSVCIYMKE